MTILDRVPEVPSQGMAGVERVERVSRPEAASIAERRSKRQRDEQRRQFALPGLLLVIGALISAVTSFVILMGLTPIAPENEVVTAAVIINLGFVLGLLWTIGYEIRRVFQARRRGKAAARLHVRIVGLFSIVAITPAILVAIVRLDHARYRARPLVFAPHAGDRRVHPSASRKPMSWRMRAISRGRRCRWPTTSTMPARSTASTATASTADDPAGDGPRLLGAFLVRADGS
jgi:hypothetical protein